MSFCDHCEGQRFDRARILRVLRQTRRRVTRSGTACTAEEGVTLAIEAVRSLDIPHIEPLDEIVDGEPVH